MHKVNYLLHADLTIFLCSLLEKEGGLADTCLSGLVVYLVDVCQDSVYLGLNCSNELFHSA